MSQETASDIKLLAAAEYQSELSKESGDFYLVDVRTKGEFEQGNIKGSKNYDLLDGTFEEEIKKMDNSKTIYLYCAKGGRSNKAAQILKNNGFTKIVDLKGGYNSWN